MIADFFTVASLGIPARHQNRDRISSDSNRDGRRSGLWDNLFSSVPTACAVMLSGLPCACPSASFRRWQGRRCSRCQCCADYDWRSVRQSYQAVVLSARSRRVRLRSDSRCRCDGPADGANGRCRRQCGRGRRALPSSGRRAM